MDFKHLIGVDKLCMESYPCQHYVRYIDNSDVERSITMFLPDIIALYNDLGLEYRDVHRQ
jgi:hypothetical protein